MRMAMSAVDMMIGTRLLASSTAGAWLLSLASFGVHCQAPAGLRVSSHSLPNSISR